MGAIAGFLQVLAGWWSAYSHLLFDSVDPCWNPAHLTLYAAVATSVFAIWKGLRISKPQPPLSVSPIQFVNVAGLKLAGFGCLFEIGAGVWNEVVHHLFLTEPWIAPANALRTVGMLTVNLGMVIGLTIEYGMIRRNLIIVSRTARWITALCVLLSFSAIWLAASGAFIHIGRVYRSFPLNTAAAVLMALMGTLVLVCVKRVMPKLGSGFVIGGLFNLVAYFFLVVYAGVAPYVPWGLLPLFLFDLFAYALGRLVRFTKGLVLSSLVLGVLFWAVYFPFTIFLFPWSSSFQLPVVAVIAGSVVGAWLGNRVYTALSSVVLGDVPSV